MKKIICLLMSAMLLISLASCGGTTESETTAPVTTQAQDNQTHNKINISVATLKGPTGIGMVKMMSDNEAKNTYNNYDFTLAAAPDEISASVIKGEVDIASVPVNLASVLYAKTKGEYQVCAVNTLGVLYVLDSTGTIKSVQDLKGKTIYATGQGSTPEYILRYVLEKNGINPDSDLTIEYKTEHSELATLMTSGDAKIGVLPEPNVTAVLLGNENVKVALDLTDEWDKIATDKSAVIQGCVIVKKSFAESNKADLDKFLEEYKSSVDYVNSNIDDASTLTEHFGIVPKAAVAKKAIPNCNITLITDSEMKEKLSSFLNVLFTYNPASIGGAIPDDNFYYQK